MENRPYYDGSDLETLLSFAYHFVRSDAFVPKSSDLDDGSTFVALQVISAMLSECFGGPPQDPENDASAVVESLNPRIAPYAAFGIGSRDAAIWEAFGFSPKETRGWLNNNVPLSEALEWKSVNPENYEKWVAVGADAVRASAWESEGFTPEEAGHWSERHSWRSLAELRLLGPAEHVAPLVNEHKMEATEIAEWVGAGIPVQDIKEWFRKGYGVSRAEKLFNEGKDVALMPDRKKGEPFPTKSWKRIIEASRRCGWVAGEPESVSTKDYAPRLSVRFTKGNSVLYGIFGSGGQFRGGVSAAEARWRRTTYDPGRMRTVDDFIQALHRNGNELTTA